MSSNHTTLGRRTFLKGAGTVGAVGLAGCTGDGQSDGSDGSDGSGGPGTANAPAATERPGEEYPTESIRSIVPYAAGGGFDAYSRLSAPYLEEYLGTDVVVENIAGGGGLTGVTQAYNAEPDGYTITLWDVYQAVTNQVGRDVAYDIGEMSHIGALTQSPNAIVVMDEAGIQGWDDFVDRVTEFDFVTQGVGSGAHTMTILLGELTGTFSGSDVNFVHYGGTGEALAGLERGEGQVFTVSTATSAAKVVQALEDASMFLVLSEPDVIDWYLEDLNAQPMLYSSDLDVENMDTYAELTVFRRFFTGPPGVPEDVLTAQRDAFQRMIDDEAFRDEALEAGRPVINPGDHTQVEESLQSAFETFETEPYVGIFEEALR